MNILLITIIFSRNIPNIKKIKRISKSFLYGAIYRNINLVIVKVPYICIIATIGNIIFFNNIVITIKIIIN